MVNVDSWLAAAFAEAGTSDGPVSTLAEAGSPASSGAAASWDVSLSPMAALSGVVGLPPPQLAARIAAAAIGPNIRMLDLKRGNGRMFNMLVPFRLEGISPV